VSHRRAGPRLDWPPVPRDPPWRILTVTGSWTGGPTLEYSADALARLNDNPLYLALGVRVDRCRDGTARSTLAPTPNACWPSPASPHGGVLFTVIDTTMAWAAMSLTDPGESATTVDCSIQYPAPATHGPFTCDAASVRRTGRTVFVRAEIVDRRGGVVALGQATFRIIRDQPA